MSGKKVMYPCIFAAIIALIFYLWNTERKVSAMNKCAYKLVAFSLSTKWKTEETLKDMKKQLKDSEDSKKMDLSIENLKLRLQNESLAKELSNIYNLLRGRETALKKPSGKIKI